jgi:hypothetical protein
MVILCDGPIPRSRTTTNCQSIRNLRTNSESSRRQDREHMQKKNTTFRWKWDACVRYLHLLISSLLETMCCMQTETLVLANAPYSAPKSKFGPMLDNMSADRSFRVEWSKSFPHIFTNFHLCHGHPIVCLPLSI